MPVLVVQGDVDLRTPLEGARQVAARFRRGRLLVAEGIGHSAIGADPTGCVARAVRAWMLTGAARRRCPRDREVTAVLPRPPRALRELPPAALTPGRAGRTVTAVRHTLRDALETTFVALLAGHHVTRPTPGLRAGRALLDGEGTLRFEAYSYVPGVVVSGRLRFSEMDAGGTFVVSGPAAAGGTLTVTGRGRFSGTLGGRRVGAREPVRMLAAPDPLRWRALRRPAAWSMGGGATRVPAPLPPLVP